ncbi:hypothetical protein ABFW14_12100 [Mycolicibacterium fortuitum]|uniref:hypothetical protein n=1 Tax=Mycolicibacterium fortuitum TaxID=1766 RepID=UPI000A63A727|nr:hypothetical protein [Mycolicibacterium fortuitum]UBV23365.1 hypothetical protein H8Z59_09655 [Mycolicibacterium fortuitum]WAY17860.1 hypothetical protein OF855_21500 [Mycolicibacterium fortuitum]
MKRLPFAQLAAERSKMVERLRQLPIADDGVRQRAMAVLERRVENWWGGALAPTTQFSDVPPRVRPAVLAPDPVELWILRAISPNARPAVFGVDADGAVCTVDRTGRYQIFVSGLSVLLDEASDICRHINGGGGFLLVERGGRFFTDLEADMDQALVVADIDPQRSREPKQARPKSFWQQVVGFLPWVHDEPDKDARPAGSEADGAPEQPADFWSRLEEDDLNARPVHQLVVDFDTGAWPASGVLGELGYKVGKNGLGPTVRRNILRDALMVDLVATTAGAESYLREWGAPNSRQRALKIERCLAGFAELNRYKSADYSEAIADWESDLAWFTQECSP